MDNFQYRIEPVSETALMVRFNHPSSKSLSIAIGYIANEIYRQHAHFIMNATPAYDSILVDYLPNRMVPQALAHAIETIIEHYQPTQIKASDDVIPLPVYYSSQVGPDIALYQSKGMSLDDIIELHTERTYFVSAIGFSAGFAFLSDVAPDLELPRQATPRLNVPKGSVAVAGSKTAIYPSASPGGWNIIGNCPIDLYDPTETPVTPFSIGAEVQFYSIDKETFIELGGQIHEGWK
ncbi:5-oxoprolinase subunit B family protein [Vibrio sp. LaRot3]|uniref:5-oxoprolinase subunit B family protein n=1 Tax=Vibrio sp. LaRot3 TaxID=2998829 RepID=UPI0022CE1903|nr:carboxyltransferase domain-containing protein [Vibrio sp. LaRot3]MDA0148478.1 carboxyltransferase domain-containing protein [Vibrio sp. LaRot3]